MQVGELYNPKRLFTGIFIPESMVRIPNTTLSPGSKLLFGRLSWHVSDDGECFPSRETLAQEIGVSESSVRDYLRELEREGFIIRVRTGPKANYYDFPWHPVLEASLRKKHRQPSVDQESSLMDSRPREDRQPSVQPIISSITEELTEEKNTPLTPLSISDLNLEDPIEVFVTNSTRRTLRIRIKTKRWAEQWERNEAALTPECLRAYWLQFLEYLRSHPEIEDPQAYFLKNPERWDFATVETSQDAPRPEGVPEVPSGATSASPAPRVDYLARWNELAPAAKTEVDTGSKAVALLREAESNPEFVEKFDEVCGVVAKIRAVDPSATWLDFYWILRAKAGSSRKGWQRLLTDMRGMGEISRPGQNSSNASTESAARVSARFKRELEEERAKNDGE